MAGQPILKVEGGRQLRATLRTAGDGMDNNLKGVHAQVAGIVAGRAKQLAPKVTGELAGTVRSAGTKTAAIVRAGFAKTPYAGPNNWGWPAGAPIRGSFSGDHWITDAAKQTETTWLPVYLGGVEKELSKVKGI